MAPENDEFEDDILELLYGKRQHCYRILFTIREHTVVMLHIRDGVRKHLKGEEAGQRGIAAKLISVLL